MLSFFIDFGKLISRDLFSKKIKMIVAGSNIIYFLFSTFPVFIVGPCIFILLHFQTVFNEFYLNYTMRLTLNSDYISIKPIKNKYDTL